MHLMLLMPLILYDASCNLCNRSILFIIKADKKEQFKFAPLLGKTASQYTLEDSSVVLIENNEKILNEAKAALRIFWLLGGKYRYLGLFYFLPAFLTNPLYRFISHRRHKLFKKKVRVDPTQFPGRFLP